LFRCRQVFLSGYSLLLLLLALAPGKAGGFPAVQVAAMAFLIPVPLKSSRNIESLFETRPGQGDGRCP
jgi:hypothetical protein